MSYPMSFTSADLRDAAERSSVVPPVAFSTLKQPIAPFWHTILVLAVQGVLSYRGSMRMGALHALNINRTAIYERTILFQWLMLGLVLAGVWWHGTSLWTVLGQRWTSVTHFLRDLGIGAIFLMAVIVIGMVLPHGDDVAARLILPEGRQEMWLWVGLSLTAGICEEALYRGYLQRQFIAFTKNVPAGIILSALAFGAAHSYQGWAMASQIGLLGAIAGTIAYRCKSVRPGMVEHFLQDMLGGFLRH